MLERRWKGACERSASSWRSTAGGLLALAAAGVVLSVHMSPWIVVPPLLAAGLVLVGAALVVDYFGVARLRTEWSGFTSDHRHAWARAKLLERRFYRLRRAGSPRTRATARSLLLAYAQSDRLSDARDVIDFLGADTIFSGAGSDPVADALRVIALAAMGRERESHELLAAVERSGRRRRLAVVGYAAARVALLDRKPRAALERVDEALEARALPTGARRDLEFLKAQALAQLGQHHDASHALAALVAAGFRRDVEGLTELAHQRGDVALALAGRSALDQANPYR